MDTDIALASLASGRAVPIGAECGCGVHDIPPGCAWQHGHEEYVWTPVCFTTSPHHGLVWSYHQGLSPRSRGLSEHGVFSYAECCLPAHRQGWGDQWEEEVGKKCQ